MWVFLKTVYVAREDQVTPDGRREGDGEDVSS